MTMQLAYPHIEKLEDEAARLERWPRVRVSQLVMDYYYDHQAEFDDEIQDELARVDQLFSHPARLVRL